MWLLLSCGSVARILLFVNRYLSCYSNEVWKSVRMARVRADENVPSVPSSPQFDGKRIEFGTTVI